MSHSMTMSMSFQDSDGELVMTLEEPETEKHPLRRVLRYPNRLMALQHLKSIGLLKPAVAEAVLSLDLEGQVLTFPVLIQDPKAMLRGFMPYPMTLWH